MIEREQPVVWRILGSLPVGVAVDAACGTGRHSQYLDRLGHRVIGVDLSDEMLAIARTKVPAGVFQQAPVHALPLADDSADLVICALDSATSLICRVPAEFVRVLKPGGTLVVSDSRGFLEGVGLPLVYVLSDGTFGYMPIWSRLTSEYLMRRCRLDSW